MVRLLSFWSIVFITYIDVVDSIFAIVVVDLW